MKRLDRGSETVTDLGRGAERIRRRHKPRVPRLLRTILRISFEMKLLGANLIIVGMAALLLFGPVLLQPTRRIDAYIVVAALIVGATVSFSLVRLALRPIHTLDRACCVARFRGPTRRKSSYLHSG